MIILGIALAVLLAAGGTYVAIARTVDRFFAPDARREIWREVERTERKQRIARLEHALMIAGHEDACLDCIEAAEQRDYQRELELAKHHAWDANEDVSYDKVASDLLAARKRARLRLKPIRDPRWEWIEVTKFGESEPSYVKGRRIG